MDFLKKLAKSLIIGSLAGTAVAVMTNFLFPGLIDRMENLTYYMRYTWEYQDLKSAKDASQDDPEYGICIVDIDDRSQQKLGWYHQWNRGYHANLIRTLSARHPAAIVFDILFFDPEDTNQALRVERLFDHTQERYPSLGLSNEIRTAILKSIDYDDQLVRATRDAGNVIHGMQLSNETDYPPVARSQIAPKTKMEWHNSLNPVSTVRLPDDVRKAGISMANTKTVLDGIIPQVAQASWAIGPTNMPPNEDGIIRAVPLVYGFGQNPPVYLPLAVRTIATLFGTPNDEIILVPKKHLDIGRPFKIFKDSAGAVRYSYPNLTDAQMRVILETGPEILGLAPGGRIDLTSYIAVGIDSAGGRYIDMKCGILPAEVVGAVLGFNADSVLGQAVGSTRALAADIAFRRDSDVDWVLTAPYGDQEWYMSRLDVTTLARMDPSAFAGLAPAGKRLVFHEFHVRNNAGLLVSSLPVLRGRTLQDLCRNSWKNIVELAPKMRMEFGEAVRIPLNSNNEHILTFFGRQKRVYPYYSYYDVLNNRVQAAMEGKIFVVGSSSPTQHDLLQVPHERLFPGVEVHVSLMNSILTNTFVQRLAGWQDFLLLLLVGVVIGILGYMLKPLLGGILSLVSVFLYFLLALTVFGGSHIWIEIARPVLSIVLTYTAVMVYRYITEEKDRRFLQATFKQYLSPDLIDMMYKNKQEPKLGGEEGIRTAYFTDIQGFSTFSEKLGSPTRLVDLLNEYLGAMTDILLKRYGTLDKYEGDAIIAFFGAPMPIPDHAAQACFTALEMQKMLGELRKRWVSEGDKWPTIVHEMRMRIGVNSGPIVTGNMGTATRMNYTMMGDAVNLAARLESAAKQYGVFTMISQFTQEMVKEQFETRQVDKIRVVGKSEPVIVYELMAVKGELPPEIAAMTARYNEGLQLFYGQKWDEAIAVLTESEKMEPFRAIAPKGMSPSKMLLTYIAEFKKNPPTADWDGVMTLTSK